MRVLNNEHHTLPLHCDVIRALHQTGSEARADSHVAHGFLEVLVIVIAGNSPHGSLNLNSQMSQRKSSVLKLFPFYTGGIYVVLFCIHALVPCSQLCGRLGFN